eukprot:Gregarina_sp_Poly_1__5018@NODE_265_length_10384_cov_23_891344_g231_i0_p4_GENE_NODE_265_length_10384_cov_23_891344_g231_i0NODE_265_length_10384_cov_23_891344_g231_i0_p4_ORF_typecomplete_len364_score17_16Herpes_gE/PF02480_16/0_18_NODE_265_length_10384_cov_23_891344_g231_i08151906
MKCLWRTLWLAFACRAQVLCPLLQNRRISVLIAISNDFGTSLICRYKQILTAVFTSSIFSGSRVQLKYQQIYQSCPGLIESIDASHLQCLPTNSSYRSCEPADALRPVADGLRLANYDFSLGPFETVFAKLQEARDNQQNEMHILIIVTTKLPRTSQDDPFLNWALITPMPACLSSYRPKTVPDPSQLTELSHLNDSFIPLVFVNCVADDFIEGYSNIQPRWRHVVASLGFAPTEFIRPLSPSGEGLYQATLSRLRKSCTQMKSFSVERHISPLFGAPLSEAGTGKLLMSKSFRAPNRPTSVHKTETDGTQGGSTNLIILLCVLLATSATVIPTAVLLEYRQRRHRRRVRAMENLYTTGGTEL